MEKRRIRYCIGLRFVLTVMECIEISEEITISGERRGNSNLGRVVPEDNVSENEESFELKKTENFYKNCIGVIVHVGGGKTTSASQFKQYFIDIDNIITEEDSKKVNQFIRDQKYQAIDPYWKTALAIRGQEYYKNLTDEEKKFMENGQVVMAHGPAQLQGLGISLCAAFQHQDPKLLKERILKETPQNTDRLEVFEMSYKDIHAMANRESIPCYSYGSVQELMDKSFYLLCKKFCESSMELNERWSSYRGNSNSKMSKDEHTWSKCGQL